jgi:hypothetical protein
LKRQLLAFEPVCPDRDVSEEWFPGRPDKISVNLFEPILFEPVEEFVSGTFATIFVV